VTSFVQQRQHAQAVIEILERMHKYGLAIDDLIQIGGEDLKSSNPRRAEKARRVSMCWQSMARLAVKFADLDDVARVTFHKPFENTKDFETSTSHTKPNEINDLTNSAPVGGPDSNPNELVAQPVPSPPAQSDLFGGGAG
jgi:hypothetical protein